MAEIVFDLEFPKEIKKEVEFILKKLQPVIPNWLTTLRLHYYQVDVEKSIAASILVQQEYRIADLSIHQVYFSVKTFKERADILSHEIAHLYSAGLVDVVNTLVKQLPHESAKDISLEYARIASEACTEDIGNIFYKLIFDGGDDGKKKVRAKTS